MRLFGFLPVLFPASPVVPPVHHLYFYAYFIQEWAEGGCSYFDQKVQERRQQADVSIDMYVNGKPYGNHQLKNHHDEAHDACIIQINVSPRLQSKDTLPREMARQIDHWLEEFKDKFRDEANKHIFDFLYGCTLVFQSEIRRNPLSKLFSTPEQLYNRFKLRDDTIVSQSIADNLLLLSSKQTPDDMFSQYLLFSPVGGAVGWFHPGSILFAMPDLIAHKAYRLRNQMRAHQLDWIFGQQLDDLKDKTSSFLNIIGQALPSLHELNEVADNLSNSMMTLLEIQDRQASAHQQYLNLKNWSKKSGNAIWHWHLQQVHTIYQDFSAMAERGKFMNETARFALNSLELRQQYLEAQRKDQEAKRFNSFQRGFIIIGVAIAISQFIDQSIADHIFCVWLHNNGYPPWNKIFIQIAAILLVSVIYAIGTIISSHFGGHNEKFLNK